MYRVKDLSVGIYCLGFGIQGYESVEVGFGFIKGLGFGFRW